MATQREIALQMLAQLRVLDPSASAEVGTPERKIIDTVAQAIAESQIDANLINGALDLDSKFGTDLDKFLAIFGFGRQKGAQATGFITFSRTTASNYDIPIPRNTLVLAPSVSSGASQTSLTFVTTETVVLPAGQLSVIAPIRCTIAGGIGNVAANIITAFANAPILGITSVTNQVPTSNGVNPESDEEFKIRFKNTVFRNLAGTQDQFLALAVSTAFTTKANVVGPISRYREYIQVPDVDDATADPDSSTVGNGNAGEYTSGLSTIPFSKFVYDTIPYFVSNGERGTATLFYRQDTDFYLNTIAASKDRGDTYRARINGSGLNPLTDTATTYQPNVTFRNVYIGPEAAVQALRPGDIVLFEHSYMSEASRNDWGRNVTNCVDVYINGENATTATTIIARPASTINQFSSTSSNRFYRENFRRVGQPEQRPVAGHVFTALYWEPVLDLPGQIVVGTTTYLKGVHYWAVEDVSEIGGTVRSRNGIEWATGVPGLGAGNEPTTAPGTWSGPTVFANSSPSVTIPGYTYDKNVIDLQAALEGSKQVTTDALAHRARNRHFKLDLTVMYDAGASITDVNARIAANVQTYLGGQYFGTTIQLSDLLQVVHNTPGVDNVRWSKEILSAQGLTTDASGNARHRVVECDAQGNPLLNVALARRVAGAASTTEVWEFYLTGSPTGGTYKLSYGGNTTAAIAYNANAAAVTSALSTAGITITVTGSGTPASPFAMVFNANGARTNITANATGLTGGIPVFNSDFYLKDDELPALPSAAVLTDTLPGLILRPRAQNTWGSL